jgi:hypothetical protein
VIRPVFTLVQFRLKRCIAEHRSRQGQSPLKIVIRPAVEAALIGLDSLVSLRGHGNPMSDCGVPMQIAIADGLADFKNPGTIGWRWR